MEDLLDVHARWAGHVENREVLSEARSDRCAVALRARLRHGKAFRMTALEKPVRRLSRGALDATHGRNRGRRLVAALEVGDLLTLRPAGTRRTETVSLFDVYRYAIVRRVNCQRLEKARQKKQANANTREMRRLARGIHQ